MSNTWFGVITGIQDECDKGDEEAIIIGKKYPLQLDMQGCVFFIDEDGDRNYGCDSEEDSSYEFYRIP